MNKTTLNVGIKNNAGIRVKPSVIVGNGGSYSSGDILDANAVEGLVDGKINNIVDGASSTMDTLKEIETEVSDLPTIRQNLQSIQSLIDADSQEIDDAIDKFEEIVDFLEGILPGSELYNIILSHIDSGNTGVVKHIEVMTQNQYESLLSKDPNTEYNII